MVNIAAFHGAFVGGTLVAEGHIGDAAEGGGQAGVEGQHGAEGGVAVEVAFGVEVQERGVYLAADDEHLLQGEAGHTGTLARGAARIHNQRPDGLARTAQQLERHHAVFAAANGDEVGSGEWRVESGKIGCRTHTFHFPLFTFHLQKAFLAFCNAVGIEELAEAVPVELAPEGRLFVGECTAEHLDRWRAGTFPVAYQFYHADVEHHAVQHLGWNITGKEGARLDEGLGVEHHIAHAEIEPQPQPLGRPLVVESLVEKLGIALPQLGVFCTIVIHIAI